jgi:hypothetical protein
MEAETATADDHATGPEIEPAPQLDADRKAETETESIAASQTTPVTNIEAVAKVLLTHAPAAEVMMAASLAEMQPVGWVPQELR